MISMREDLIRASQLHFKAHIQKHKVNVENLLENSVGVAEHPDIMDSVEKELEIIKAETLNSGKPPEMVEKISKGKLTKFLNENSLLNQAWIMDPKKTVQDVIKDYSIEKKIKIIDYVRYKVGEGVWFNEFRV